MDIGVLVAELIIAKYQRMLENDAIPALTYTTTIIRYPSQQATITLWCIFVRQDDILIRFRRQSFYSSCVGPLEFAAHSNWQ